jgi:tetratricopeptide (TPR) repeat protein
LERVTLRDSQVGEALGGFITIRYEAGHADADAVIKRFNVNGFPTLLVLGPDGAEWDEVGAQGPADLVKDLARIRAGTDTLPALRQRLSSDPRDTKSALDLAGKLANRHAGEAVEICERLLETTKGSDVETQASILFLLGYAESNRDGFEAALGLWERVITEFPTTKGAADAARFCGNVLPVVPPERGLAFLAKVLPCVDKAQRDDLERTRGYLHLKAAEDAWLRRGEAAGDEPEALNRVAWECFQRGWHTDRALAWARKAVALSNRDPNILDTLANLLFRSGALEEAIRTEEEALAKVEDAALRLEFEQNLCMWKAAHALRQERARASTKEQGAVPR